MKTAISALMLVAFFGTGCGSKTDTAMSGSKFSFFCSDTCHTDGKTLSCKLPTPEIQKRKTIVTESLRRHILEVEELENGYAFKLAGTDKMIDEITEFVKTERVCCDFFTFNILINGDTSFVWMQVTGPKEAKQFLKTGFEL